MLTRPSVADADIARPKVAESAADALRSGAAWPETRPAAPIGAAGAGARPVVVAEPPGAKSFIEQAKKRLSKAEYGQV